MTGSSGFIGFHLSNLLLSSNWEVIGLDSMDEYYDVNLKKARLKILQKSPHFHNYTGLVQDEKLLGKVFLNINLVL